MRKNGLCVVFFVIVACFMSNVCLADTSPTGNCDLAKNIDSPQIPENTQQEKAPLTFESIFSYILEVPGDIIDSVANIPLDDIVSSTLEIPGDAVKFVAEIPYDEVAWSALEVSAEVIEFIVDDGFFLGFFMGYYCSN